MISSSSSIRTNSGLYFIFASYLCVCLCLPTPTQQELLAREEGTLFSSVPQSQSRGQCLARSRYSASEIRVRLSHFSWSQMHKSQKRIRIGLASSGAHPYTNQLRPEGQMYAVQNAASH